MPPDSTDDVWNPQTRQWESADLSQPPMSASSGGGDPSQATSMPSIPIDTSPNPLASGGSLIDTSQNVTPQGGGASSAGGEPTQPSTTATIPVSVTRDQPAVADAVTDTSDSSGASPTEKDRVGWDSGANGPAPMLIAQVIGGGGSSSAQSNAMNRVGADMGEYRAQTENEANANENLGASNAGIKHAEAEGNKELAAEHARQAAATAQRILDRKGDMRQQISDLQKQIDAARSAGIDPNRLDKNMTGGQRLMYGIAAALSGAAAGFNHQTGNLAIEQHQRAIENDIAAQRESINSKRLAVADYKDKINLLSKQADEEARAQDKAASQREASVQSGGAAGVAEAQAPGEVYKGSIAAAQARERGASADFDYAKWLAGKYGGGGVGPDARAWILKRSAEIGNQSGGTITSDQATRRAINEWNSVYGKGGPSGDTTTYSRPAKGNANAVTPAAVASAANRLELQNPQSSPVGTFLGFKTDESVDRGKYNEALIDAATEKLKAQGLNVRSPQQIAELLRNNGLLLETDKVERQSVIDKKKQAAIEYLRGGLSASARPPGFTPGT